MSSGATDGSSRPRTQSARSLICIEQTSAMFLSSVFDDRASLLLDLLGEPVGQPCEPPQPHPHREIQPFDVAGRDVGGVGLAVENVDVDHLARGRRVAATILG